MWTDHKGKLSIRHPDQTGVYSVHKLCLCSRREPFPWNNNASSVCWLMTVASNDRRVIGHPVSALTSMGVLSGTSLRITMQRFWLGRTFSPFSSTWTNGKAAGSHKEKALWAISGRINQYIPPNKPFRISWFITYDNFHRSNETLQNVHLQTMKRFLVMCPEGTHRWAEILSFNSLSQHFWASNIYMKFVELNSTFELCENLL